MPIPYTVAARATPPPLPIVPNIAPSKSVHLGPSNVMPNFDIFLFLAVLAVVLAGLLVARGLWAGLARRRVSTTRPAARGELVAAFPLLQPVPAAGNREVGEMEMSARLGGVGRTGAGRPVRVRPATIPVPV